MANKVIFVGIDGIQLDEILLRRLNGEMPNLNSLNIVEAYTGGDLGTPTQQPTVSGPGWSTLLTGVWNDRHGVTSNNDRPINAAVDSIFEAVDRGIPGATIASVVNWSPINTGHFARENGMMGDPAVIDIAESGLSDAAVTQRMVSLINNEAPDFSFIQLDDVDGAGHTWGFGPEYEKSLIKVDQQVGAILDAVAAREAANPGENWMVVVSTDHGRYPVDGSGHSGQTASERRTFIASNVELGTYSDPVPVTSVATTILDFLNIDYQIGNGGYVSGSVLEGVADPVPPTLAEILLPSDNTIGVDVGTMLEFKFSEDVQAGNGNILIRRVSDDTIVETIQANSAQVTINGVLVKVDPANDLDSDTAYYVEIQPGAFTDGVNAFGGFADKQGWNFTTGADPDSQVVLFQENFEGLTSKLGPFVSGTEGGGDGTDFTSTMPDGWNQTIGAPAGGPVEFYGWTFFDVNSWITTAGDQLRSDFLKGDGVVMVADPDEYDDGAVSVGSNLFNAAIRTPAIDLSTAKREGLTLSFDSSWRYEGTQSARITVSYDGGAPVEVLRWSSENASPFFKPDATNERVVLQVDAPEGAQKAVFAFEMFDAGNNWWWAIDNIEVAGRKASEEPEEPGTGTPTAGNDMLTGTAQADEIHALAGNDVVQGLGGDDKLFGDAGNDTLIGGEGHDILDGGEGDDLLTGEIGNDHLLGGVGTDVLDGGEGNDTLEGGAGSDIYNYRSGDGADTIIETAASGDIDTLFFDDAAEADVTVRRHGQDLQLTVAGQVITLKDQLAGNGSGIEMVAFADGASLTGEQLAAAAVNRGPVAVADTASAGEAEAKVFDLIANDLDEDLDTLTLSAFDVASVNGIDLTKEQAKAAFSIDAQGKLAFTPGEMFKTLEDGDTATVTLSYKVSDGHGGEATGTFTLTISGEGRNLEVVTGTAGSDVLTASENGSEINAGAGNDYVFGASAGDVIHGEAGNDYLFGNGGDDIIDGGAGHDTLFGGDGNDRLIGGAGNDRLVGGAGSDTFEFAAGFGSDTVMDFADGDVIDVSEAGFADYAALSAAITDTALGATLTLADGSKLTIASTTKADLTADDFLLAA